ncbi:hypothetical protein BDR03DRAFT_1016835 [Suillus americanus]|nr:hypothetical protein BDR03DRAFT_1016835 [Suillus americanus]
MPVIKASAAAIAKKHFSKEVFDMCWSTEAEPVPSVETLTASSLAEPPYSSQTFEMCWDIKPYPAPTVNAPVNASVNASVNALVNTPVWFMRDGVKVIQQMVYPPDHPEFPNEPKGIKAVLAECGLSRQCLRGRCKKCESDSLACCYKRILELQADFQEQNHLCKR